MQHAINGRKASSPLSLLRRLLIARLRSGCSDRVSSTLRLSLAAPLKHFVCISAASFLRRLLSRYLRHHIHLFITLDDSNHHWLTLGEGIHQCVAFAAPAVVQRVNPVLKAPHSAISQLPTHTRQHEADSRHCLLSASFSGTSSGRVGTVSEGSNPSLSTAWPFQHPFRTLFGIRLLPFPSDTQSFGALPIRTYRNCPQLRRLQRTDRSACS